MQFLYDNCTSIILIVLLIGFCITALLKFKNMPKEEQLNTIRAWLLSAVMWAEATYGSGTGRVKLSEVYTKFCTELPWLAKIISFTAFSDLVDEALVEMRRLFDENAAIAEIFDPNYPKIQVDEILAEEENI